MWRGTYVLAGAPSTTIVVPECSDRSSEGDASVDAGGRCVSVSVGHVASRRTCGYRLGLDHERRAVAVRLARVRRRPRVQLCVDHLEVLALVVCGVILEVAVVVAVGRVRGRFGLLVRLEAAAGERREPAVAHYVLC